MLIVTQNIQGVNINEEISRWSKRAISFNLIRKGTVLSQILVTYLLMTGFPLLTRDYLFSHRFYQSRALICITISVSAITFPYLEYWYSPYFANFPVVQGNTTALPISTEVTRKFSKSFCTVLHFFWLCYCIKKFEKSFLILLFYLSVKTFLCQSRLQTCENHVFAVSSIVLTINNIRKLMKKMPSVQGDLIYYSTSTCTW